MTVKVLPKSPSWCEKYSVNKEYEIRDGYAYIVNDGEKIVVEFEMKAQLVRANPKVFENGCKAALMRGPIVYCMESVDNGEDISDILISQNLNTQTKPNTGLGVDMLEVDGYRRAATEELYVPLTDELIKTRVRFIPYYTFANRGEAQMLVWCNIKYEGDK